MDKNDFWKNEYVETARDLFAAMCQGAAVNSPSLQNVMFSWEKAIDLSARMARMFIDRMKLETGEKENAPE